MLHLFLISYPRRSHLQKDVEKKSFETTWKKLRFSVLNCSKVDKYGLIKDYHKEQSCKKHGNNEIITGDVNVGKILTF